MAITFDDGFLDNWVYAYPILKKYGHHAVIWMSTDFVDPRGGLRPNLEDLWERRIERKDLENLGYLSWDEMRRMVGSAEVEDLTQEVFLRAFQALPNFRKESKFSTWVYKIARNLCLSELRRQGRRGEHVPMNEVGEEKVHQLLPQGQEGLEEQIERSDLSRRVQELIEQLPMQYRTVLTLFYVNEARYEEIADVMEIPLGTVKTYIHRARLRLRDLLLAESDLAGLVEESGGRRIEDGGRR